MTDQTQAAEDQVADTAVAFKSWLCVLCGFVYHEHEGLPAEGIAPGTAWKDVPEDWVCPECGAGKADFEMVEI